MHNDPMPRRRFTPTTPSPARAEAEPKLCLPDPYSQDAHLEPLPPGAYGLPGPAFLYAHGERGPMMDPAAIAESMRSAEGAREGCDDPECRECRAGNDVGISNGNGNGGPLSLRGRNPDELLRRIPADADGVLFPASARAGNTPRDAAEPIYVLLLRGAPRASAWPYVAILVALLIAGLIALLVVRSSRGSDPGTDDGPWDENAPGMPHSENGDEFGHGPDDDHDHGHEDGDGPDDGHDHGREDGDGAPSYHFQWDKAERALRDFDARLRDYIEDGGSLDSLPRSASIEEIAGTVGYDARELRDTGVWDPGQYRFKRNGDHYVVEVYVSETEFVRLHDTGAIQRPR